ncbi:MAG: DUF721 domain-containing protein [Treponemataceae bacterium]|nr:DUF721 domain-containing protein [Treponemataceae bacterium]
MKKASEILSAFFDNSFLVKGREYAALFNAWKEIAGEQLAAHSRIREFERSIIIVEAEHPGWIQLLQTKQRYLIDSFQKKFPELHIHGICFKLAFEKISDKEADKKEKDTNKEMEIFVEKKNINLQEVGDRQDTVSKTDDVSPEAKEKISSPTNDILYKNIHDKELIERLKRLEQEIKKRWEESRS